MLMGHTLQSVIVGILGQTTVVEGPGQPINSILLVLNGLHHDLSIHVVSHPLIKMAFHRKRLVNELLVILLLGVLRQQHHHSRLINARTRCSTHHLQDIMDGIIHISVLTTIELLGVHDDHQMCQHRHPPAELFSGHQDLDSTRLEETFNHRALRGTEAFMEEANTILQCLLQRFLPGSCQVRPHGIVRDVQEALGLVVGGGVQQQIDGRHAGLLSVRDEDDDGFLRGELFDGLIHRATHGQQARGTVVNVEPLDDQLQGHRTHVGGEVEQAVAAGTDPFSHILGIGQGRCQGHDSDGLLHLHRDVTHATHHSLQGGTHIAVQQVEFINHKETNLLDALSCLPPAAHQIPPLRGGDHNVGIFQDLHITRGLSNQLRDSVTHGLSKLEGPLVEALLCRGSMWCHIDTSLHGII
mmetsp:Transcript_87455/g.138908  ORF Transcript_87455/g.138908 Transcript_87455/m.138908 type:complete len:412 (+) Transcript_87455:1122-2357(+)